jgi:hypothetical protein
MMEWWREIVLSFAVTHLYFICTLPLAAVASTIRFQVKNNAR